MGRPTSRNAVASRSSRSRPCCIRSSCCTPPGLKYLLVASIVYAPGTFLYIWARREQGRRVFQLPEAVVCVVLVVAAVVGIILISTGYLAL